MGRWWGKGRSETHWKCFPCFFYMKTFPELRFKRGILKRSGALSDFRVPTTAGNIGRFTATLPPDDGSTLGCFGDHRRLVGVSPEAPARGPLRHRRRRHRRVRGPGRALSSPLHPILHHSHPCPPLLPRPTAPSFALSSIRGRALLCAGFCLARLATTLAVYARAGGG